LEVVEVRELEIESIKIPEWAERMIVSQHEIDDLARSIESNIQIEPIIVRRLSPGEYELVSGYMRLNALKKLSYKTVEAKIVECSDEEALTISLEENLKRSEMHPFDIARKIAYMKESLGLSDREIGRRLSRDKSWVSIMLAINSICDEVKRILAPRIRDIPTLYEVSKLEDAEEQVLASEIISKHGLGRRDAQSLVKDIRERGLEAVKKEYERLLKGSEALTGEDLNSSKEFNMLNTSQEHKGFSQQYTSKPQESREAQEARRCDICGEEKPKQYIRYVGICKDKHEDFNKLMKIFRKHGYEKIDNLLAYVCSDLESLLAYPVEELPEILGLRYEITTLIKGLDLEMLRELVKEVRKRYGKN